MDKNKKTALIVAAGVGVAIAAVALASRKTEAGGEVDQAALGGYVIDSATTMGISGAVVSIGGKSGATGASGYFNITGLTPGDKNISVSANGYESFMGTVTLVKGLNTLTIPLTPGGTGPGTATLIGVITDADTGTPIVGATINVRDLSGNLLAAAASQMYGNYERPDLPVTTVTWEVVKAGYETKSGTKTLLDGDNTLNVQLTVIQTGELATVAGWVAYYGQIEPGGGYWLLAVRDATVTISGHTVNTGPNSEVFRFGSITFTPGLNPVHVTAPGFQDYDGQVNLLPGYNDNVGIIMQPA
ncbi:MAG: carboxypeptidase regulatory-like domain-containing protein [Dehalococcoidales bacterium]|nr:carboxypeptidase regulatory-like domain-containing protein [Dehalococcoidales bacterium]